MWEKLIDWLTSKVQKWQTDYKLKILDKKTLKQHKKFTNKRHVDRVRYAKKSPDNLNKLIVYMDEEDGIYQRIEGVYRLHEHGKLIEKSKKKVLQSNFNPAKEALEKAQKEFDLMELRYQELLLSKEPTEHKELQDRKDKLALMRGNLYFMDKYIEDLKSSEYGIEEDKANKEIKADKFEPPLRDKEAIKKKLLKDQRDEEKRLKKEADAEEKRLKAEAKKKKEDEKKAKDKAKVDAKIKKVKDKADADKTKLKAQHQQKIKQVKNKNKKATPKKSAAKGVINK